MIEQIIGLGVLGLLGYGWLEREAEKAERLKEEARLKEEMPNWSIAKLHAFAGLKQKYSAEIRSYAYNLAKEKKFDKFD